MMGGACDRGAERRESVAGMCVLDAAYVCAYNHPMRTTLVIDDAVLEAARHRAVDLNLTLSGLVEQALRRVLDADREPPEPALRIPTWGAPTEPVHHEPADLDRFLEAEEIARLER